MRVLFFMEEWKKVNGHPDYEVSNLGNIRSLKFRKQRILKPMLRLGYLRVDLDNKTYSIHKIVAFNFINNPHNKPQINHINGVKHDNRVVNLEWCTGSENIRHAIDSGLKISSKGEYNGQSKLKNSQVLEIRNSNLSSRKLGVIYGVDKSIILDIKNRVTWKHI